MKILDFGLAKLKTPPDGPGPESAGAPSLATKTGSGVVLGTVDYMAPEQVR